MSRRAGGNCQSVHKAGQVPSFFDRNGRCRNVGTIQSMGMTNHTRGINGEGAQQQGFSMASVAVT